MVWPWKKKAQGEGEKREERISQSRGNEQERAERMFRKDFESYERTSARAHAGERFLVEVEIGQQGEIKWHKGYDKFPGKIELPTPMILGIPPGIYPAVVRLVDLMSEQEYLGETKLTVLGPEGDKIVRILYPQERDYSGQKGIPFIADIAAPTPYHWILTLNGEPVAHDEREMRTKIGFSIPIKQAEEVLKKSQDGRTHELFFIVKDIDGKAIGYISRKFFYRISGARGGSEGASAGARGGGENIIDAEFSEEKEREKQRALTGRNQKALPYRKDLKSLPAYSQSTINDVRSLQKELDNDRKALATGTYNLHKKLEKVANNIASVRGGKGEKDRNEELSGFQKNLRGLSQDLRKIEKNMRGNRNIELKGICGILVSVLGRIQEYEQQIEAMGGEKIKQLTGRLASIIDTIFYKTVQVSRLTNGGISAEQVSWSSIEGWLKGRKG
ncbi:MAG TPA: hypothetical protein HA282_03845 [Nanoarchaeota archaeon]|nr:hypothetical protein [Candidatus Pacearchaeota archaeon]HIH18057.1 hypothetical protein [Nanoarchaeota archaeon]HIH34743.1 hypothetical protein [Nanoarchaeota archaeon]HIH51346.1 hypothetical protein [Nanoarchaeota archaeon]HIH66323.1 hypothetical protein [Nanoarchaeota archaeon]